MRGEAEQSGISNDILCAEYQSVYHYVLSLCRNKAEAEDVTQETFLKAMKAADRFEGASSLYTWLCSIAKNLWLNRCKQQKRQYSSDDFDETTPSRELPLEQLLIEQDLSMHVHRVLHGLPEPYKEVFSLRVFGQLSFANIAVLFSRTESWARVTYHRARKQISETLRKDGLL